MHPHPELWLRGYGADRETHNHNVSWNDVDEQIDVFISTRIGITSETISDSAECYTGL